MKLIFPLGKVIYSPIRHLMLSFSMVAGGRK